MSIIEKNLKQFYDRLYKAKVKWSERWFYKWICELLPNVRNKKVLDIGCGNGEFLERIYKNGGRPFGVEISHFAFRPYPDYIHCIQADAHFLPFKDESFDYVTCLGVLEHLVNPTNGINEMKRVLKFRGIYIVVVPNKFRLEKALQLILRPFAFFYHKIKHKSSGKHQPLQREYSFFEAKKLFEKNGFKILNWYSYNRDITVLKKKVLDKNKIPPPLCFHHVFVLSN